MKQERVELHLHTNMSAMDGVSSAEKLIRRAAAMGHSAVAITDHGVVQAFPAAMKAADKLAKEGQDIKIIYGVEAWFVDDRAGADIKKLPVSHLALLAQNQKGLKNLYKLISVSHLHYCYGGEPHIPRSELEKHREGLLVGSACKRGELLRAIAAGEPWERLCEIAGFYDYLEIQPIESNQSLSMDAEQLRAFNRTVVRLGEALGIPVCATGDVHFCEPEDAIYREILLEAQPRADEDERTPLYLRSTDEMLAEFAYLGEEKAYEVVVTNPNRVAGDIEKIRLIPEGVYPLHMDGAEETLRESVWSRAKELYGEPLPDIVKERLKKELSWIIKNGHATQYIIVQKLVQESVEHGYPVMSRGGFESSLAAYMAGITEINPLPPHYICPSCHHLEFFTDGSIGSGFDLPEKTCPVCGAALRSDGHDIPSETFMGFGGEKAPYIALNVAGEYKPAAYECLQSIFGKERVLKAGRISTILFGTALGYVEAYAEKHNLTLDRAVISRLADGFAGLKCAMGQDPAWVMIIPEGCDVHDFTPVQYLGDSAAGGAIVEHLIGYDMGDTVLKVNLLGDEVPAICKYLEEYTGIPVTDVPMCDPAVYSLFTSPAALGVTPAEINCETGTRSLPGLYPYIVLWMIQKTHPEKFSDLMQSAGLAHGIGTWDDNAEQLIKNGVCALSDVIATQEGIMTFLTRKGMEEKMAYEIMEIVRDGKASKRLTEGHISAMRRCGVPEWYIESCMKIRSLYPKAHAAAYMMATVRLGWYKIYRPTEYYAAWFTANRRYFDAETVMKGKEALYREITHKEKGVSSAREIAIYPVNQAAYEAMARGIAFLPPDATRSHAMQFLPEDGNIRLPLACAADARLIIGHPDGKIT